MMNQGFLRQITEFVFPQHKAERADIIFIPGSNLPQLAEEAAGLYRQGMAPYILPSGRYSIVTGRFEPGKEAKEKYPGEYETEWEFLFQVLRKNQVPKEAILREDQATYTYQNAIYSRKVTDSMGLKIEKAILCCKPYHGRRSLLYYQLLYPDTEFLVCPIKDSPVTRDNWYLTKEGTNMVFGEIERIGLQFYDILDEMREQER